MTDRAALLIPLEGEPEVLTHPQWRSRDIVAALGAQHLSIYTVPAMSGARELLMFGPAEDESHPVNRAAHLLNPRAPQAHGPLLVLRLGGNHRYYGLDEADLAVLATLLAIGELKKLEST